MAVLADIVIDCQHPAALARFWAAVLDGSQIAQYDDDEITRLPELGITRLAELGITDLDDDPTVLVEAVAGPRLWFQKVPESKTVKNRMRIDVRSSNLPAESSDCSASERQCLANNWRNASRSCAIPKETSSASSSSHSISTA